MLKLVYCIWCSTAGTDQRVSASLTVYPLQIWTKGHGGHSAAGHRTVQFNV